MLRLRKCGSIDQDEGLFVVSRVADLAAGANDTRWVRARENSSTTWKHTKISYCFSEFSFCTLDYKSNLNLKRLSVSDSDQVDIDRVTSFLAEGTPLEDFEHAHIMNCDPCLDAAVVKLLKDIRESNLKNP